MANPGQMKKAITVYYHGKGSSFMGLPSTVSVLDIKTLMSVRLYVPVEKLALRFHGDPPEFELKDDVVLADRMTMSVHVELNIVVRLGEARHSIAANKDSNGKRIKHLVALALAKLNQETNGVLNMKLGLIDEDANNQLVSVGDDTLLYTIKDLNDGAEFVLEE